MVVVGNVVLRIVGLFALAIGVPALVIVAVLWAPVVAHFWVGEPVVTVAEIQASRVLPTEQRFAEINDLSFGQPRPSLFDDEYLFRTADSLFDGEFSLGRREGLPAGVPFDPADLVRGPVSWQLRYASLLLPSVLVEAYERSGEERYLLAARDFLLDWQKYEGGLWLPKGFIWNDHALAARVVPLAKFWSVYRSHPSFAEEDARRILELVARTGRMLADPDQYTFATNHGKFQNLALFHLALSFPALSESDLYLSLARERFAEQMEYLVAPDGAILEHTAEYHFSGLERLTVAFRYFTLAGMEVPADWWLKYEKAMNLHREFIRPDGSLPRLGNTKPMVARRGTFVVEGDLAGGVGAPSFRTDWDAKSAFALHPVGGFAAWWHNLAECEAPNAAVPFQIVANWSHFPGHAHKHADELSVNAWADGVEWLAATGFWPYGAHIPPGRRWAISWPGSNAPHLRGEAYDSERESDLLAYGSSCDLSALHLRRTTDDGFAVQRQIISLAEGVWVVVDSFDDVRMRTVDTFWTFDPEVTLHQEGAMGQMRLSSDHSSLDVDAWFLGPDDPAVTVHRGSLEPAAGWAIARESEDVIPAYTARVERPSSGSWSAAVFRLKDRLADVPDIDAVEFDYWNNPVDWALMIRDPVRTLRLVRSSTELTVSAQGNGSGDRVLELGGPVDVSLQREKIRQAFAAAEKTYGPKFSVNQDRRVRLTVALLGLVIAQEVFFFLYKLLFNYKYMALRLLAAFAWLPLGLLIHLRYFA
jgi:hypothetical protein